MKASRLGLAAAILLGTALLSLGPALSAAADDSSTTTFAASASQTVSYGTNWVMPVRVAGTPRRDFVVATSGTVNILINGMPGNYVTGLPLTPGGQAFFSPPSSKLPLPAGTYVVRAVYVPSGTAFLSASQTLKPATLTVTALSLSSSFAVNKETVDNRPSLQVVATVTATPPNANAAIPDGTWQVTAKDAAGRTAFTGSIPLPKNPADPIKVSLSQKVKPGHAYTISAEFLPAAAVAGGYQVKNVDPEVVTVEAESFREVMSTPFAAPIWMLGAIGLVLVLLIASGIILLVTGKTKAVVVPAEIHREQRGTFSPRTPE